MTLSASEIESLRMHLSYGNVAVGALPYTPDGFWATFEQIISPNLGTGTEDASTTATTANAVTTITLTDASEFTVYDEAVIDVGDNAEIVVVQAQTTGIGVDETITAHFTKAHSSSGYPVATMSGKARLRLLLHDANKAWREVTGQSVGAISGLKSVDKGDVVWQDGGSTVVLQGRLQHYEAIQAEISRLCRVQPALVHKASGGGSVRLECY